MKPGNNFYDVLGVSRTASASEIEAAYDNLLKQVESGRHELDAAQADHRIQQLNQAYWALSDAGRRAAYDASLAGEAEPMHFAAELVRPLPSPRMRKLVRSGVTALVVVICLTVTRLYLFNSTGSGSSEAKRIQEAYDAMNGKLSDQQRSAAEKLAEEMRQKQEADRLEYERNVANRSQEYELERDRDYANRVAEELREAEDRKRREAEEAQRRQAELDAQRQEQERERIEALREKWRGGSSGRSEEE